MRSFTGNGFLSIGFFITLSSAAAIHQQAATPNVPALTPMFSSEEGKILKPINIDAFKSAANLEVRDEVDFSRLDLALQAELIFGTPGDNGSILLANMTLYAPDGQQIVMMESFEGLTSAVDCKGDDGIMSLTFSSKEAFDAALEKWSFINEKDEDSFLLIANHDGCGEADQRQAYTISGIDNEEASLMTILTAKIALWSEIAGSFDLNFGDAILAPGTARRLMSRSLFGAIGDFISDIGSTTLDQKVVFDVTAGNPGKRFNVLTDPSSSENPAIVLDCVDCFMVGKFVVSGKLSVKNFNVQELTLDTSPQDFSTKMELEAKIAASVSPNLPSVFNLTKEVASFPVPAAGIVVPGIFKLGAVVTYEVAVESSIAGTAGFNFGLQTSLPNNAHVVVNLADINSSTTTGFEATTFDPIFDFSSGSATLSVAAISRPKLTFGVEVVSVRKLEAGLNLGLPRIDVALTAAFDKAGVCEQVAGASTTGFKVASNITLELNFSVNGNFGPVPILGPFSVNLLLQRFQKPLFSNCFPFNIPGLDPSACGAIAKGD